MLSVAISLRLFQCLNLSFNVIRIATILTDSDFDLTVLHKKLTEFSSTFSHYVEQAFGDDTFVADGSVPNNGADAFGNTLSPELSDSSRGFEIVPVSKNFILPDFGKSFLLSNLRLDLSLLLFLLKPLPFHVLTPILFNQLISP